MRRSLLTGTACGAVSMLFSGAVLAEPETHDGFFMRAGVNLGPAIVSESIEFAGMTVENDISGFQISEDLLFGGTVAPGFVVGGGLLFGHTSNPTLSQNDVEIPTEDGTMLFLAAAAFVNYYLIDPTDGLNLQALVGFGAVDFVSAEGASGGNDPTGPVLGLGVGYDFWVGSEFSIGPFARFIFAPMSADAGGASSRVTYLSPTIGAAFTYH